MAGGISIHVIDVSRGVPARGMAVALARLGPERTEIAAGELSASGTFDHPVTRGEDVIAGMYEVRFEVGAYYRKEGMALPSPAFLETAPFVFGVADPAQHYHLPLKMTPWGFSLFRGGA